MADPRFAPAFHRPAMDRDMLSKLVVIADEKAGGLSPVASVLRGFTQNRAMANQVALPHLDWPAQARMALDDTAGADPNGAFKNGVRAHLNIRRQIDFGSNDRGWVNEIRGSQRHHPLLLEWGRAADNFTFGMWKTMKGNYT
jgi:hypothetical protein